MKKYDYVRIIKRWVEKINKNRIVKIVKEEDLRDNKIVIDNGKLFKGKW
jgi:serine protease inhibitor